MRVAQRSEHIGLHLNAYLCAHSTPPDAILRELAHETAEWFPNERSLAIAPEQGRFMTMIAQLIGARTGLEIGTFTGYSSICLARGLSDGGHLLCCDISDEWTSVARKYWDRAGLAAMIELRLGPALDTVRALPPGPQFDIAFIDASPAICPTGTRSCPGSGPAVPSWWTTRSPTAACIDAGNESELVQAVRDFNDHAAADDRVDVIMLPLGDGLTLARKK